MGRKIEFKYIPTRKTFGNSENDYKIYSGKSKDANVKYNSYGSISIKGDLHELPIGVEHAVKAEEENDSRYGYSYKVITIEREIPNDETSTRMFLNEILTYDQVNVLMDVYPDIVDRVINDNLDDIDLSKTKGIKEYTFNVIKRKIIENFAISRAIIEFGGLLDFKTLKKLYDEYGSTSLIKKKLSKEPYKALCRLARVGFKTADTIILSLEEKSKEMIGEGKVPAVIFKQDVRTSKDRMKSSIEFVLSENENSNKCTRMKLSKLKDEANILTRHCMHHFKDCIKESKDVLNIDSDGYVSRKAVYEKGVYISGKIIEALDSPIIWNMDSSEFKMTDEGELTDEQGSLLDKINDTSILIFRGSGGSGKSFSAQKLIEMLEYNNKSVTLLAPTGRASKVIGDYTKRPASTIHRGLGYTGEWSLDHFNNILSDVVLVDESSMCDLDLFYRLISAIDFRHTKLVVVGDPDQLPSVGAGNVYHDLIQSNIIPTVTLTKIFRYGTGGIDTVCTDARNGKMYIPEDIKKPITLGEDKGFMFLPSSKQNTVKTTVTLYKALLNKGYKPEEILVLSAQNVGSYGTKALNEALQKVANSHNMGDNFIETTHKKKEERVRFYDDDLIIQTANNYKGKKFQSFNASRFDDDFEGRIFIPNGDIGKIYGINESKNKCAITFDEVVLYEKNDLNNCLLGYSISGHKSQGGQAKAVIAVTPRPHMRMLTRNLLYVMMSRARVKLFQIGEPSSIPDMLKKKENWNRDTNLQTLLKPSNKQAVIKKYHEIVEIMEDKYEEKKQKEMQEIKLKEEEFATKTEIPEFIKNTLDDEEWDNIPF